MHPSLPLPPPLRGSEIPSFTHYSIVVRLPEIARRTLSENEFPPENRRRVEALIAEIPAGPIRPLEMPDAPDAAAWDAYVRPYSGMNWLDIPWFFAEEYFYQRVLEACGYLDERSQRGQDPYAYQKRMGLETTRAEIEALCQRLEQTLHKGHLPGDLLDDVRRLLVVDLWGNQNDLSLWPASHEQQPGSQNEQPAELREAQERILDNHLEPALEFLAHQTAANTRVDFLLDNAGFELVCDLALVDLLLSGWGAAKIVLHLKIQPVFVSDALEQDVLNCLHFLDSSASGAQRSLAQRLREHLADGRLQMRTDPFWTSPLALWEMPAALQTEIGQAQLLISKGDANYRRILGDRHWNLSLPFAQVVDYLPSGLLALRTLKSEIAVGVATQQVPSQDPKWMSNGQWGLIQFAPPAKSAQKSRV